MKRYLPDYYDHSPQMQAKLEATAEELEQLQHDIDDVLKQLFIDSATWGLSLWEKDFSIPTDETKPLEERRSVIKSKKRGLGKVDADLIKLRCDAYTNGGVEVTFNGAIVVKFTSVLGAPPNMSDLEKALEEIKPAHLRIEYEYSYLLLEQVHQTMTLDEIQQRPLTDFAPFEPVL